MPLPSPEQIQVALDSPKEKLEKSWNSAREFLKIYNPSVARGKLFADRSHSGKERAVKYAQGVLKRLNLSRSSNDCVEHGRQHDL